MCFDLINVSIDFAKNSLFQTYAFVNAFEAGQTKQSHSWGLPYAFQ
jgi:hypothetical protein